MKARIKSNGKIVEVISRFMPKKRNAASRDWVCNLSDGTCIDESELEYISDNIEGNRQRAEECVPNDLEEASDEYAEKHGFRVPYDGSDNFYDDVDVKASKEGFIAGAKWAELTWEDVKRIVQIADKLCPYTSKDIAEFQENFQTEEAYYREVLKQFNDGGKENTKRD